MLFSRVLIVKLTDSSGAIKTKTIKVMKRLAQLLCCALFLFAGIKGMQSNFTDILPTQQVAAESVNKFPVLNFGQPTTNNASAITHDTVYVDSSAITKQVTNQQTPKVRKAVRPHPARVIYKTKTRYKSHIYVAIPRGGEKLTLDSVLKDTANWSVHRATDLSTSKDLTHFVRD